MHIREVELEWSEQNTTYLKVEWMMCAVMNSDLSSQFHNLSTMEIVDELKERFIAQVKIARFECLNEFSFTQDGRKHLLGTTPEENA